MVTIIGSLCLSSFPFCLSILPVIAITSLICLFMVRSISSSTNCKGTFLTKSHLQVNSMYSWQHMPLQQHAKWETALSLVTNICISCGLGSQDQLTNKSWINPFYISCCSSSSTDILDFSIYPIGKVTWKLTLNSWCCLSLVLLSISLNF